MPMPTDKPCPSEPVAAATHGRRGVGCPSRSLVNFRRLTNCSTRNAPASAKAAYRTGAACPFDRTKRSFPGCDGLVGSKRMEWKKIADTRSAADKQEVG